ncbi:helix-turn-helix transcriptional regulator [Streptomonospora sp. S1-112]|uniref:Helix-turn-helix transcriptional regulator n=1 Tax=Streptomonospora mangrovi TaxID=2883123 RepID=A0A9X3NNC6_9ACTN|nr:helix-turn-helix transcriptional regulator [Streptomonospora mangrovi]MDA0565293.1 helix-turn-helix transcriptional regulator [Streptomonospora mangrovi]
MADRPKEEWLRVGTEVRRRREELGLSLDRLAERVPLSAGMLGAIERGVRGLKERYAPQLDEALRSGGQITRLVAHVSKSGIPLWLAELEPLLGRATLIRQWQLGWIPGLLQTEDYARAVVRAGETLATEAQLEQYVRARMRRQQVVWQAPQPRGVFVIDEAVLERNVGGEGVMIPQWDHLLAMAELPHVTLHVLPLSAAPHVGLDGSFQVLRVPGEPGDILVLENRSESDIDHVDAKVAQYSQDFEDLRGLALPPAASIAMIRKARAKT